MALFNSIVTTVISAIINLFSQRIKVFINHFSKLSVVHYVYSASAINKMIAQYNYINLESTSQLSGKYLDYDESEKRKMTIRNIQGQQEIIALPYKEIINFINNPSVIIKINPLKMANDNLHDGAMLIKSTLHEDLLIEATNIIEEKVRKDKPNTYNGSHPRLKTFKQLEDGSYTCSFEKTCYFAQIRTNLSLDYLFSYKSHDTTFRELEMAGRKKLTPINESKLANVIGVSAIWCMEGKDKGVDNRRFFLLPRVSNVGVYTNSWGCPAGDIECPKDGVFKTESLVDFLKWEIAREFFEETGVQNTEFDPNRFKDNVDLEFLDDNNDKLKKHFETLFNDTLRSSHKCEKMEIIPLAFLRELLRGGKPMVFFLIRTEWIEMKQLRKSFHKSMGKLEFKKKRISLAPLSTEATCNYLYAQAYLQNKPCSEDCIDLSR